MTTVLMSPTEILRQYFFPDHDGYIRSLVVAWSLPSTGESCLPQGVNLVGNEATIAPLYR